MKLKDKIFDALRDKKGLSLDRTRHSSRVKCFFHDGDGNNLVIFANGRGHCFSRCGAISLSKMCLELDVLYEVDGMSLEEYSEHFRFPINTLKALGFETVTKNRKKMVKIPIYDEKGNFFKNYFRTDYEGQTHKWDTGTPRGTIPYGLDKVDTAHSIYICEGMTDYLTVMMASPLAITPVAILGTSQWRDEYSEKLIGKTVYVQYEKDSASFNMIKRIAETIPDVRIIEFLNPNKPYAEMPKDANQLYLSCASVSEFIDNFDAAKKRSIAWEDFRVTETKERLKEIEPKIKRFLSVDVVKEIIDGIKKWGYVGSAANPFIIYCAITSRVLKKSISVFLEAAASTGKNATIDAVKGMFPESAYKQFDALSEKALFYHPEEFKGKAIIMTEQDSLTEKGVASSLFRSALDNKKAEYAVTTEMAGGGHTVTTYVKEFECLITTGIYERDNQRSTRMLKLDVTTTPEQIKEVAKQKAKIISGDAEPMNYEDFQLFQEYIELKKPKDVKVPYIDTVFDLMPMSIVEQTRFQRLSQLLMSFIQTVAVIHMPHRKIIDGALIADIEDYKITRQFLNKVFAVVSADNLTVEDRRVFSAVEKLQEGINDDDVISAADVAEEVKRDRKNTTRNIYKLINLDLLENKYLGKNKFNLRTIGILKEQEELPTAEEVLQNYKSEGAIPETNDPLTPSVQPEPSNNAQLKNNGGSEGHQLLRKGKTTYVQLK